MGKYAAGKYAYAISDRSGLRFPYDEMVREWNGSLVHMSEFEPKQPQLEPKPVGSDPQALFNPRPQPASKTSLILLDTNPFTSVIYAGTTYVNVFSENHQRAAGSIVRFRGSPQVTSAGPGGADPADLRNLQAFATIPTFDNVSDLNNTAGFTIALGQIDSAGNVTGATTTDPLTQPINYFYITSTSNATTGGVSGGGDNCSAGPVTLEVVNG
tara:strand:+ start:639 stop:1277 length:639 start_codon:yes stop_codon:yes gene_type:complete